MTTLEPARPPTQAYVFAAPEVKQRVNAELASWWPSASAAHSPVLLAWAAVLRLMHKGGADGRHGGGAEWEAHAGKAHETDALGTLCQLTRHAGLQPNAAEMFNNIVLRWALGQRRHKGDRCSPHGRLCSQGPFVSPATPAPPPPGSLCSAMSAAFCAFNFSPAALPLPQLELVARVLANLFRCAAERWPNVDWQRDCVRRTKVEAPPTACKRHPLPFAPLPRRDQPALCEGFWAGDRRTGE